ncbi:MAG: hypothetical protein HZRFUVUK_000846 [Candidatus Fervidibacterota bacterium]|jgi:signal peptidase II
MLLKPAQWRRQSIGAVFSRWLLSLVLALLTVFVDQVSKAWVCASLPLGSERAIFGGLFYLKHVRNYGIAFGVASELGSVLLLICIASLIVLLIFAGRLACGHPAGAFALGLVLGGGLGNMIDRVFRGSVVDFIDLRVWPVFNVADVAITVGMLCILVLSLFPKQTRNTQEGVCSEGDSQTRHGEHLQ